MPKNLLFHAELKSIFIYIFSFSTHILSLIFHYYCFYTNCPYPFRIVFLMIYLHLLLWAEGSYARTWFNMLCVIVIISIFVFLSCAEDTGLNFGQDFWEFTPTPLYVGRDIIFDFSNSIFCLLVKQKTRIVLRVAIFCKFISLIFANLYISFMKFRPPSCVVWRIFE